MTGQEHLWRVRLTNAAEFDIEQIIRWTEERFGELQSETYKDTLSTAFNALTEAPDCPGARRRDDIHPGYFTLHVSRRGRRGRHMIMYRVVGDPDDSAIEVLRVLHDAMDLARHLPDLDDEG